jgi:hypothetical protein
MASELRIVGPKERRPANDAQVMTFFRGYDASWHLGCAVDLALVVAVEEAVLLLLERPDIEEGR